MAVPDYWIFLLLCASELWALWEEADLSVFISCLPISMPFWPVFQVFSIFLSLTQAEFSMTERGTSPWEQLLENKPLNKANLYNQVKWCLNYYKYFPGYNGAESVCPFVTMKQTPRNASQELLALLQPPFCNLLVRLLTGIPSKGWKTSLLQGEFYSVFSRSVQPWNTEESGFVRKQAFKSNSFEQKTWKAGSVQSRWWHWLSTPGTK